MTMERALEILAQEREMRLTASLQRDDWAIPDSLVEAIEVVLAAYAAQALI